MMPWHGGMGLMAVPTDSRLRAVPRRLTENGGDDLVATTEAKTSARSAREPDRDELEELIRERLHRQTPSLMNLAQPLAIAAIHDVTVLLTGETGTGKTFLARLIHDLSARNEQKFLAVPCGALAHNLVESELFGHVRGAFTGADRARTGKFAAAGKGTILLDEIDTLGLDQQARLLRIIETGEYEPVGGNDTCVSSARIIAASNWNLEEAVAQGRFRQDLYYRLHVLALFLPPLRERTVDIEPLAQGFLAQHAAKFRKDVRTIHGDALNALRAFSWPGNIRQLENVMQLAVLGSAGAELLQSHLPKPVLDPVGATSPVCSAVSSGNR